MPDGALVAAIARRELSKMTSKDDFKSAVNGWKQSVGIMRKLRDGLAFAVSEIEAESKRNPHAFGTSDEKAARFYDAQCALRTADTYLSAMEAACDTP